MTRAYRKNVIQPLVTFENGKEFHLEVLLKLNILGFRIGEIPAVLEWKDNKCISAEIYVDRAVFDMEVTEKWLNSLDIEYEVNNLDDSQYRKVF